MLDLDGLRKADAGGGQLAELMVKFGAVRMLPGGDEKGHTPAAMGGRLSSDLIELGFEIFFALHAHHLIHHLAVFKKEQGGNGVDVKLRGQIIGVLNIKAPTTNRTWNQDEINLAEAISDRLAIALDNARLLQDSQRRAAKEQKIGDVTAKIGASINMRSMLQTAVEELGRALPGSEVVIQFESNGK